MAKRLFSGLDYVPVDYNQGPGPRYISMHMLVDFTFKPRCTRRGNRYDLFWGICFLLPLRDAARVTVHSYHGSVHYIEWDYAQTRGYNIPQGFVMPMVWMQFTSRTRVWAGSTIMELTF